MLFKVIQIDFDFTTDFDDEAPTLEEQINLLDEVKGSVWEAENEEELVEKLTSIYGWCINSLNFETFSKTTGDSKQYKTVYVTVALRIDTTVDTYETISECDYQFSGEGIQDSEIISVVDANDDHIF
jgi:hypothetical protein